MKIGNKVKYIIAKRLSSSFDKYINSNGIITEIRNISPDIMNNPSSMKEMGILGETKELVLKLDKPIDGCSHIVAYIPEVKLLSEQIFDITDDYDDYDDEYPTNDRVIRDKEVYVIYDPLNNYNSFKGTLYDIVNKYIIGCAVDNEWSIEEMNMVMNLRNKNDIKNFLEEYMSLKLI